MSLVAACVFAADASSLIAQQPIEWKFTEGETHRYEIVQRTEIHVDAGDAGKFATVAEQTLDVAWRIDKVTGDGSAEGVLDIERLQVTIAMPDGLEMAYDSDSDEPPMGVAAMLSPLYAALLEAEIPMTVAKSGELLRFEPSEETVERITGVPATRAMSDLVTGAGLRQIAEHVAFSPAPRNVKIENRVLGTLQGKLLWNHVEQQTRDSRVLERFESKMSLTIEPAPPSDDDAYPPAKPIESPKIAKQTIDGEALFDVRGYLERSTLHVTIEITGKVIGSSITSKIEQTVDVQRKN